MTSCDAACVTHRALRGGAAAWSWWSWCCGRRARVAVGRTPPWRGRLTPSSPRTGPGSGGTRLLRGGLSAPGVGRTRPLTEGRGDICERRGRREKIQVKTHARIEPRRNSQVAWRHRSTRAHTQSRTTPLMRCVHIQVERLERHLDIIALVPY